MHPRPSPIAHQLAPPLPNPLLPECLPHHFTTLELHQFTHRTLKSINGSIGSIHATHWSAQERLQLKNPRTTGTLTQFSPPRYKLLHRPAEKLNTIQQRQVPGHPTPGSRRSRRSLDRSHLKRTNVKINKKCCSEKKNTGTLRFS